MIRIVKERLHRSCSGLRKTREWMKTGKLIEPSAFRLFTLGGWLETYQLETVQDDWATAISATGIKIVTCVTGSIPDHDGISIIDLVDHLVPYHFTGPSRITPDVNAGTDFK